MNIYEIEVSFLIDNMENFAKFTIRSDKLSSSIDIIEGMFSNYDFKSFSIKSVKEVHESFKPFFDGFTEKSEPDKPFRKSTQKTMTCKYPSDHEDGG